MKYRTHFLLLLGWCWLAVVTTSAQSWEWRNLTPATGDKPEARRLGGAVFDPVGKRVIVFGGFGDSGFLNDTWAFNVETNTWAKLATTGAAPSVRQGFDMIYDPVGQQVVIYNGQGAGLFNDTWTLNLTTLAWRDVSPSDNARPRRRYGSTSIFDPATRSLVQFAGFTSEAGRFQDTQSFGLANNTWTDWTPAGTKPRVRCLLTGAYDRTRRRMIIYGGQNSGALDDLWAFDLAARTWTNLTPASKPAGRWFTNSFVDAADNFILFGGTSGSTTFGDLWSYNFTSGQWTQLNVANGPSARSGAQSAYDETNDRWYVIGGGGNSNLNDVWVLQRQRQVANVAIVSSASYAGERVASESIATAFGVNLATATQAAATIPLPLTLQGTSVRVKDSLGMERAAPLFFVSPNQINFQVPPFSAFGAATVGVYNGETLVGTGTVNIAALSPGLFTANADGRGAPAAILFRVFEDFSHTTENLLVFDNASNRWVSKVIDLGREREEVFLILYGTGLRFNNGLESVTATIGGVNAPVSFASAQGQLIGLDQMNVRLPRALIGRGEVTVEVNVSGQQANAVRIAVK